MNERGRTGEFISRKDARDIGGCRIAKCSACFAFFAWPDRPEFRAKYRVLKTSDWLKGDTSPETQCPKDGCSGSFLITTWGKRTAELLK